MGYFSNIDAINKNESKDREDLSYHLREQMITIIRKAYPFKSYLELVQLNESSLRGLYGQAKKKLKLMEHIVQENSSSLLFLVNETDDLGRSGR